MNVFTLFGSLPSHAELAACVVTSIVNIVPHALSALWGICIVYIHGVIYRPLAIAMHMYILLS